MEKILIANRGEIAVRVIKTARELGYKSVAVYSDVDADNLHVRLADEAFCLGGKTAAESYLVIDKIVQAAKKTGADAIHPGYGFLSENADFARACESAGLTFIGPRAEAIELMGNKRLAKQAMIEAGVPCIPGYQGPDQGDDILSAKASEIGFPVMIKAAAGGGGRGMRRVASKAEMRSQIASARSEALSAFGSDELILERALAQPRHIEFQIFGDDHGTIVHLFERDCSLQRRHQKVIEEAPSPFVDKDLRRRMALAAIEVARSCDYRGAGTVEFLVDAKKDFYFLEMNTRLQVEHPVTEMITGIDLVAWQFMVAEGEPLPLGQDDIAFKGHAVEVRLYAEDPASDFMPQSGPVVAWLPPEAPSIRTDSGIRQGQEISPYYDPLIAKMIAYGDTRTMALRRLALSLEDCQLLGVTNNKAFVTAALRRPAFIAGEVTTAFIDEHLSGDTSPQAGAADISLIARAALSYYLRGQKNSQGWTSAADRVSHFKLAYNDKAYDIDLMEDCDGYHVSCSGNMASLKLAGADGMVCYVIEEGVRTAFHQAIVADRLYLDDGSGHYTFDDVMRQPATSNGRVGDGQVKAPMDGAIIAVKVTMGDAVTAGQTLIVMEAMKMEHSLKAAVDGVVAALPAVVGQQVKVRQLLARVDALDEEG